ncbi:serine hydrolase [Phytoactinopolyspora mesophila]|nr:serine hydrolase [Phytoactinopolyspora mesophila]
MTTTWPAEHATKLRSELNSIAAAQHGRWAFAVREGGGLVASVNGDEVMRAASTIKVALLILALQDVEAGQCRLDSELDVPEERAGGSGVLKLMRSVRTLPLREVLELMIGVSDNCATNIVVDLLGLDHISARINALGARSTRLERRLMDLEAARSGRDNVTTADDQALLLDLLTGTQLLSEDARRLALDILGRQQFNDRMPARLGPDIVCRHKTGELSGVRHDVGILEFDGRQVVLAALSSELADPATHSVGTGVAADVIGAAAQAVVENARTLPSGAGQ